MTLTIYDDMEQGTDKWLQARAGIVTASTVGKLITSTGKVARNDTSRALTETLIAEHITGRVEWIPPTRDMQRGTMLEPFARDLYQGYHTPVTEIGFARRDEPSYALGASPDGLTEDDDGPGGIEIKSPRPRTHLHTLTADVVPPQYMPQIQACILVLDRAWWDFVSYCPGMPLYVKRVHPIPRMQEAIIEACEEYQMALDEYADAYGRAARQYAPTEYFDPFEDEEVTYG